MLTQSLEAFFMKTIHYLFTCLVLTLLSFSTLAENNPLSVHVLNLQNGLPSAGVKVTVEKQQGDAWQLLNKSITDENGRIVALFPENKSMDKGIYKVTFATGEWFKAHQTETFFPIVPVIFEVDGKVKHYHIPLLISPYGYSTYRGN